MILESHRSSLDVIHCIMLLVDSRRRVINLYVVFLMTAGQLGTLLAVNIPLALQYIGKPCSILNALLYATCSLRIDCAVKFHHSCDVYIFVQRDLNNSFFTPTEHM